MPKQELRTPALSDPLYSQALKSWYSSLRDHDPADVRGHVEGLICVLGLLASRIPPGPRPAFVTDHSFDVKVELWRSAIADLLGCRELKTNGIKSGGAQ